MALSQIQCLDDNHVNPRTHESKPEFLYCEDQRLALEALLKGGREAFIKCLEARGLRGFLSDPELDTLVGSAEPFDPDADLFSESAEDDDPPLSQHYWPELSDTTIPQMDLGWPDNVSYRGVTRTTVYSQPPLEGQTHIKEVVRKMIAQAQKVIAVVMDVFTDVDIFRDLLDVGFKKKVSVYILLEHASLPHFLSMCQRANMHAGHLKHLRVRCTNGAEFYSRSCRKVQGQMGHRFMFIDGDKAVSGSYSFTWMSARLNKNLITVVTGQAADTFDRLFRTLYSTSSAVDLRQVATEPEPQPEPISQPVPAPLPSAAIARKLHNPKYALVNLGNPNPPAENNPKETQNSENSKNLEETDKKKRRGASKEDIQDPQIHPGLVNLEKVCLISYLPTWPEPDPPKDVIGFINIVDAKKSSQVHLQRSELFETSQAIRFSSPFSMPKETLPDVAMPRQISEKLEMNTLQPTNDKAKVKESHVDKAALNTRPGELRSKVETAEKNSSTTSAKCQANKDTTEHLKTEKNLSSNTTTNQEASHNPAPNLSAHTPLQSSAKKSTLIPRRPAHALQTVADKSPEPDFLQGSNTTKETSTQSSKANSAHTDSNKEQYSQKQTVLPQPVSQTQAVHTQSQNSSEITPIKTPTTNNHVSTSSASENNTNVSLSSSVPPLTSSSSATPNLPLPSSSSSPPTPPIPKPRTFQLLIKDSVTSDGKRLQQFSVSKKSETITKPVVIQNESNAEMAPEKQAEIVPRLQNSGDTTETGKDLENMVNISGAPQEKEARTSQGFEKAVLGTTLEVMPEKLPGSTTGTQTNAQNTVNAENDPQEKEARASRDNKVAISGNISAVKPEIQPDNIKGTQKVAQNTVNSQNNDARASQNDKVAVSGNILKVTQEKQPNIVTESQNSGSTSGTQNDVQSAVNTEDSQKQKEDRTLKDTKEAVPDTVLEPSGLTSTNSKRNPMTDVKLTETNASGKVATCKEIAKAPNQTSKNAPNFKRSSEKLPAVEDTSNKEAKPKDTERLDSRKPTNNTHSTSQEINPKSREGKHTPEKTLRLPLCETNTPDLLSPERESRWLTALARTPTPDGLPSPSSESRTHTPDPRSYTPDFRTPTPDVSDGYVSAIEDSNLSTTSEEFYDCVGSPLVEPNFYQEVNPNGGTTEDHVSLTNTNSPNAANKDKNCTTKTSSSEIQNLPAKATSSSKLEKEENKEEECVNKDNGRERDENKVSKQAEGNSQGAMRTDKKVKESKEVVENNKEAPKKKKVVNQSAAEKQVEGGGTLGTKDKVETRRLSTSDIKTKPVCKEKEGSNKEKAPLGSSVVMRREKPQTTRETEGQKLLNMSSKPEDKQQDNVASSAFRPTRPARPLSGQYVGPRPWGGSLLNKTEGLVYHGSFQVLDNANKPMRPPPPGTAGALGSTGRRHTEVSRSQQSLLSQQSSADGRKPKASIFLTNSQTHLSSHSHNQALLTNRKVEGMSPFSFTFSRLYSLKDLKDKMSKLPVQSKRSSTDSPSQGRKSTS
ncbi:uncharacterized protein LOC121503461 [Cheilinus undulatus]|uniref:uncharacterized protein LOC121503461 n=1 Tax=Cheilinus undulatus TaxID=241271 RepID=UPI001BD3EE92|nr:uncharacterized protein LOC121503461 [Cheilinus undulatus]